MEPWYKAATPRAEVREGRSFNPDEFAIALEQLVAGRGPDDYRNPDQFFARTCFTRALRDHTSMVLRRLSGRTENTAPVMSLVTQFGGGKTHTLAALYHLANSGDKLKHDPEIATILRDAGLAGIPKTRVAVFVGNAWDPSPGRETPWLDLARQLAGNAGVAALGPSAQDAPPGTAALGKLADAAGGSILVLCDEVLNYINRYRTHADKFHAFIQNLTVAMTGTERSAAVISLPRSQVEMSDFDLQWQEKINKIVRRVAKDLIANDEAEISEVMRKRLFESLGSERIRRNVARAYADWCFARRSQLPPEWTAVDAAATDAKAQDFLRQRFESCYPFHPATISVFHRKWQGLRQFQQTRGALAMFAQWISYAYKDSHAKARNEPLITLGSAPLDSPSFRAAVLGQLGESRLLNAIETDIAGQHSHARALDVDTSGQLRDIHRRVAVAILFESSGAQNDKFAHLPELRFALGEPGLETTSIDTAAHQMETRGFFIRKKGSDGFQFGHKPTLKKVVNDRRASLDEDETAAETNKLVLREFERGRALPLVPFPDDGSAVPDTTRLTLVIAPPGLAWAERDQAAAGPGLRTQISEWTRLRGASERLYPGALIWCIRKEGRDLRAKVENLLAWRRVQRDYNQGTLSGEFERGDVEEIRTRLAAAEEDAADEVWASYRYIALFDPNADQQLKVIDIGAGHANAGETLTGRALAALRTQGLLNESPGASYIERKWPEHFRASGAWPLSALRQAFLSAAMGRLLDPEAYIRSRVPEFVRDAKFGYASGARAGGYANVWFEQPLPGEEISFDPDVYLLLPATAAALKSRRVAPPEPAPSTEAAAAAQPTAGTAAQPPAPLAPPEDAAEPTTQPGRTTLTIRGEIPTEVWNRLGRTLIPKLKSAGDLTLDLGLTLKISANASPALTQEIHQILRDLGLSEALRTDRH